MKPHVSSWNTQDMTWQAAPDHTDGSKLLLFSDLQLLILLGFWFTVFLVISYIMVFLSPVKL
jgi:hypothetical protein